MNANVPHQNPNGPTDFRPLIAIALCVTFYLGYEQYLKTKYPDMGRRPVATAPADLPAATSAPAAASAASGAGALAPAPEVVRLSADELTLATDVAVYRFSQESGGIESIKLSEYAGAHGDEAAQRVEVLDSPLILQGAVGAAGRVAAGPFQAVREGRTLRFTRTVSGFVVAQEYRIPEKGYGFDVDVTYTNTAAVAQELTGSVLLSETLIYPEKKKILGFLPGQSPEIYNFIHAVDGSVERHAVPSLCDDDDIVQVRSMPVDYFGFDKHYFLSVVLPKQKSSSFRLEHERRGAESCHLTVATSVNEGQLAPGASATIGFRGYVGPKDLDVLGAFAPALERAVDFGKFGFIARPLLAIIQGFYSVLGNYGLAIIALTFLLKVLFYPLTRASALSMHKMKKLNPQMADIREKWKDDKQRQQQELMKFMAANKVNPMKGCLPVLPQIPVFFAFYQVLQSAIELRHAPFFGWIQDLSAMDPYLVTPLLLGVAMFIQQKLTPTTGMDKTQEKILMFMPLMFTVMMLTLPAGLTLYMLTNTVTGIAQQQWLYRKLDKLDA